MSSLINFWPFKSFFEYVFQRSFGKFLKNGIDLKLYDFSKKKITFKNLDINTQVINDSSLKNSPFKLISCTIGRLQINNLTLNFLTQNISIEVSNIDIIVMPVFSPQSHGSQKERSSSGESAESDEEDEIVEKGGRGVEPDEKSEAFNILNNLVNKIFSNLEAKIATVTIRLLTKELGPETEEDIPTILLRLSNLEYKKNGALKVDNKSQVPSQQGVKKTASDLQAVLDGKTLDISEVSVHLMKATHLYPDEFIKGKKNTIPQIQQQLSKLRFPQEYPLTSHPNTILLIKDLSSKGIEVVFSFPQLEAPREQLLQNKLQVKLTVPCIESIIDFKQLKTLLNFSFEIVNISKQPKQGGMDFGVGKSSSNSNELLNMYGELVRNNQKFKEQPINVKKNKNSSESATSKSNLKSKLSMHKDKLIFKFLKSKQDKQELHTLKEDMKKSIMTTQSQQVSELVGSAQSIDQSMFMYMSQYQGAENNVQQKQPLSVYLDLEIVKVFATIVLNENGAKFDNQYEANMGDEQVPKINDFNPRFAYSHYSLQASSFKTLLELTNVKKIKKQQSFNPFDSKPSKSNQTTHDKLITIKLQLSTFELIRNNLHEGQHPKFAEVLKSQASGSDINQYESFVSSSIFKSASEFYTLIDSKIGMSTLSTGSKRAHGQPSHGQANPTQPTFTQSESVIAPDLILFIQHPPLLNPVSINPYQQHFCSNRIIEINPIIESMLNKVGSQGTKTGFLEFFSQTHSEQVSKKQSQMSTKAKLKIGGILCKVGLPEFILISTLTKGLQNTSSENESKQQINQPQKQNNHKIEAFSVQTERFAVQIGQILSSQGIYEMQLIGATIENNSIEVIQQFLSCHIGCSIQQFKPLITLELRDFKIVRNMVSDKNLQEAINFTSQSIAILLTVETDSVYNNVKILNADNLQVEISLHQSVKEVIKVKQEIPYNQNQQPFVIYEGQDEQVTSQKLDSSFAQNIAQARAPIQRGSIKIRIKADTFGIALDFKSGLISQYIEIMTELENTIKLIIILQDISKCYNKEIRERLEVEKLKRDETYMFGANPFAQNNFIPAKQQSTNIELDFQINDSIQIFLFKQKMQQCEPLLKFRLMQPHMTLKYIPPSQSKGVLKKERVQIHFKAQDIMVIDYCQQIPIAYEQFEKKIPKKAREHKLSDFFQPDQFLVFKKYHEDLLQNEHQVIIYRQQGYQLVPCLDMKFEVQFLIQKPQFDSIISVDKLAQLFVHQATQIQEDRNRFNRLYNDIAQMKKNPMILKLNLKSQGLVLRLVFLQYSRLLENIESKINEAKIAMSKFRNQEQKIPDQNEECQDKIELSFIMSALTFDYKPSLRKQEYDQVNLSDFISVHLNQSEELKQEQHDTLYKSNHRSLIYVAEISLLLARNNQGKGGMDLTVKVQDLSFRMLHNQIVSDQDHDQVLFLDVNQRLDKSGGLWDQMGFSQILYIDLLELTKTQLNDVEEELKAGEDDLFATSYGSTVENQQVEKKPLQIILISNKVSLYLSKDSLHAIQVTAKMFTLHLQQFNANQKNESDQYEDEVIEEDSGLQKMIEEFLIMDYDPSLKTASTQLLPEGQLITNKKTSESQQEEQKKGIYHINEEDGYFTINTALYANISADLRRIPEIKQVVNMQDFMIDDYLPVLSAEDVNLNRHRQCHSLTDSLKLLKLLTKIHIELHSFQLKLFEGSDFDFISQKPQGGTFGATLISTHARKQLVSEVQKMENNSLIIRKDEEEKKSFVVFKDDYMMASQSTQDLKKVNKTQSEFLPLQFLRRPRKQGRGNYLSLHIGNLIFTSHELKARNNLSTIIKRQCFSVENLILKESISSKDSHVRELLYLAPYQIHFDNQIECIIQNEVISPFREEVGLNIKIQPFKLMLNQAVVRFILNFFDIKIQSPTTKANENPSFGGQLEQIVEEVKQEVEVRKKKQNKKEVFVTHILIQNTHAIFSYTSRSLSIIDLTSGNLIELMNLLNINDLRLNLPCYDLQQRLPFDLAMKHLLKYYLDDLVSNQKANLVKAIGPIRSLVNVTGAFYGLVSTPYKSYMSDKGLLRGLSNGAYQFYSVIAEESHLITSKVVGGVSKVSKAAAKKL